jgi:hypothetical protein
MAPVRLMLKIKQNIIFKKIMTGKVQAVFFRQMIGLKSKDVFSQ